MSSGNRTPQEVLDELGADLAAAAGSLPGRRTPSRRRVVRVGAGILAAAGVGVSTAAATTSIFTSPPPLPRLSQEAVILASGSVSSEPWELVVSRCAGASGGVSLLIRSAAGGAGTACGGVIAPPTPLYDPVSSRALVFGALPAGTAEVELVLGTRQLRVAPSPADADALVAAGLPRGIELYVTSIARDQLVTAMTAFDASGHLLVACQVERCALP
jgi:hypothetical protein